MNDVTRALERAAEAITKVEHEDADWPWHPAAARAAVLACAQSLPPTMTVAELAAAIEKERT